MPGWQLQRDVAVFPGLRLRVHRIGLAHWHPGARLRSWGVAPLHQRGNALHLACGDAEALWLGAWPDADDGPATIQLRDPVTAWTAAMTTPRDFQLTGLCDAGGLDHPIALQPRHARRELQMDLRCEGMHFSISLVLHPPTAWAALACRDAPGPLDGPPALPPRLG